MGDKKSDITSVLHGAAQGTVLGPTIFILYFDAISKSVSRCKLSMFADDCVIYQTGNAWDVSRGKLQLDLNEILRWTSENSLSLNGNKTQAIIFGPRAKLSRIQNPDPIMISNVSVKFVKQYSYLGVTLDREMSLQPLIKSVKKSQHSPFYKGTLLWNDLSGDIQFFCDIFEFKKLVARKYMIYENLLETNV